MTLVLAQAYAITIIMYASMLALIADSDFVVSIVGCLLLTIHCLKDALCPEFRWPFWTDGVALFLGTIIIA